jgi:Coenzyme PQQ synthesis protein D (PqqD)
VSLPVTPRQRENIETHLMPDGSALLYDPATGKGHVLNVTGSFIWEYCDGTLMPDQIAADLAELLPQEPNLHAEALRLIAELEALGLFASATDAAPVGQEENA